MGRPRAESSPEATGRTVCTTPDPAPPDWDTITAEHGNVPVEVPPSSSPDRVSQ